MHTTEAPVRTPQRSDARSNRRRILDAAQRRLRDDPDRHALIAELTQEAARALQQAFAATRIPGADPLETMTRMALAAWAVGDQYRMLISLGRHHLGEEMVRATLAPAREEAIAAIRRGQHRGVFADHVPAPVLAQALEALMLALAEENTTPTWADPTGEAAATAFLVAAGVAPQIASRRVRAVLRE
ncbi:TetR/AcrR family transcriptional regulator [Streptomyces sp. NPDC007883]|uniref:TetR/AcrR family transcriptional regulator n=1 Tax=Streptomyces sp. NPDC007883 TaxID=3155116 RepID=UPI0033FF1DBA